MTNPPAFCTEMSHTWMKTTWRAGFSHEAIHRLMRGESAEK